MVYAVQDIKASENLVQAESNARASKTGFYSVFLSRIRFLCVLTKAWFVFVVILKDPQRQK